MNDQELQSEDPRLTHNNNLTTSQLVFTPKIEDESKLLTCVADNQVFPKVNKSSELNVYFIPGKLILAASVFELFGHIKGFCNAVIYAGCFMLIRNSYCRIIKKLCRV